MKKNFSLLLLQRLLITLEHFNRKGLMNHAAACAYGFLLSAAPALLFISFIIFSVLSASPELVKNILGQMDTLIGVFCAENLIVDFLSTTNLGLTGLISVITIFWTTRICALSIQRGLGVVFPGTRSIIKNNAVTIGLGLFAIVVIIIALVVFSAFAAFIHTSEFISGGIFEPVMIYLSRVIFLFCLALLAMAAYRFFPANPPALKKIVLGVIVSIVFYQIFSLGFSVLINPGRYNLLYGTLGRLFLFLINVYFFFVFFFFGAQLIQVLDISDALLFIRLKQIHLKNNPKKSLSDKIFSVLTGPLIKYRVSFKKGDTVFSLYSSGQDVYYILSGKAGVYLDNEFRSRVAFIDEHNFFGEMATFTNDERTASIKAETDLCVLKLPPDLFRAVLQLDPDIDQNIIKTLSQQLKSVNLQIQSSAG